MTTKTLLAVDGNSLVHRSYHALAASGLRRANGDATWAVKGFMSQLINVIDRIGPDAVVVGFDDAGNSTRRVRWPHYKATRKEKPADLAPQLTLTAQLLRDAGIHVVTPTGLEADDVLASAAATATAAGWRTVIVTSDRDAFALVDEHTSVLRLLTGGVGGSPLLNPERLHSLTGVRPDQYREYAAMRGDTSDNLAGITGVGEKTAAKLLAEFDTVGAAFDDVDNNAGARVSAILGKAAVAKLTNPDNREAFYRNCEIMTMHTDLDITMDLAGSAGSGILPLDATTLVAALDACELVAIRADALRLLAHSTPRGGERAEEPAQSGFAFGDDYRAATDAQAEAEADARNAWSAPAAKPAVSAAPSLAAMAGSRAPRPAVLDDLF